MLPIKQLVFGELDARSELTQQRREGIHVFMNSFQSPPSVAMEKLEKGAKYYIRGAKGSGKTALIWYLREKFAEKNNGSKVVLFKSDLTEVERQRLLSWDGALVFSGQGKIPVEYDYKFCWIWFIVKTLVELTSPSDVVEGSEYLRDLRTFTKLDGQVGASVFSGLQFTRIKAAIEGGLKAGPLTSSIKAEIEAVPKDANGREFQIVSVCEKYLSKIRIRKSRPVTLFFDELEVFFGKEDQKNRDLALVRDLLYAVGRVNRGFGSDPSYIVYASVRSEVLNEINRIGPEERRQVIDFGVDVRWSIKAKNPEQPILKIVEAKIRAAEAELHGEVSQDVWSAYFPPRLLGRPTKEYLLDLSMFRPRNLLLRLKAAQDDVSQRADSDQARQFQEENFLDSTIEFSNGVWAEIEEDLLTSYSRIDVSLIKDALSGFRGVFTEEEFSSRLQERYLRAPRRDQVIVRAGGDVLKDLYRLGAVGNRYKIDTGDKNPDRRDRWVFRGYDDPLTEEKFVVHESLRKALQLD